MRVAQEQLSYSYPLIENDEGCKATPWFPPNNVVTAANHSALLWPQSNHEGLAKSASFNSLPLDGNLIVEQITQQAQSIDCRICPAAIRHTTAGATSSDKNAQSASY